MCEYSDQHLPSVRLCIDHQVLAPHQNVQRSAAPAAGDPPQTGCTDSWRSLHMELARRGWINHLFSALTDPQHNSLCWSKEFILITIMISVNIIITKSSIFSSNFPLSLPYSSLSLARFCFLCFPQFSLHVSVWFLPPLFVSFICAPFIITQLFVPVQVCLSVSRW